MPANVTFLLVEGPHDAEFMARLLKLHGFEQTKKASAIPEDFRRLIPKVYPAKDVNGEENRLIDPHPVPRFYQDGARWVFILIGGGSKSAHTLGNALRASRVAGFNVDAIGVIIDQDFEATPEEARDRFVAEFGNEQDLPVVVDFGFAPGTVVQGEPRLGLFVLPDNSQTGALEDLLLECGEVQFKELKEKARLFRDDALQNSGLTTQDLKDYGANGGFRAISKQKKAMVSAMGAILMPSVAIQNCIRENRWLEGEALELPSVKTLRQFIEDLIA
jgi:hypothetical protein